MLWGFSVDDDSMAIDVIEKAGHEGHFLGQKHTLDHVREMWLPSITDGSTYTNWVATGSKTVADRAKSKAQEIIRTHDPTPLDADIKKEFAAIIKEGEANIPR
jgi:trimethylamine--corrinoid protein Co-methyltransferase